MLLNDVSVNFYIHCNQLTFFAITINLWLYTSCIVFEESILLPSENDAVKVLKMYHCNSSMK